MCYENEVTLQRQFYLNILHSNFKLLYVARNVAEQGLAEPVILPESDSYDSALCCLAADIDFDGQYEVLIGTYGQVMWMCEWIW